jgi:uncharacterized protein YdcH (DUF465 family)
MIKYFKELLKVLKSIDTHLNELRKTENSTNEYIYKLSKCVKEEHNYHGDRFSISTKHWND